VLRFVIAKNWFPVLDPRLYDFANLPLIVLVATVLGFVLMPALNAISRHHERQADRYAWENTPAIAPFISSMQKLADQNLAEREPATSSLSCSSTRTRRLGSGLRRPRRGQAKQPQEQTA
jgi:Zn-dependent protease with chaperone function